MSILGPILGAVAGPLISGLFGSQAAAPAAQSADSAAQAQAAMVNELIRSYQQTFAPAQQNLMGQYMGLVNNAPIGDISTFQMLNNLLPTFLPDVLRSRAEYTLRRQGEQARSQEQQNLIRRGIGGAAGERLLQNLDEQQMQRMAGLGSDIMGWEAEQTLANRNRAFEQAMQLLGLAGQYSQIGSAFPGTAIAGAGQLTNQMMGAAAGAAQPYQQMGANLGSIFQNYFSNPNRPPLFQQPASSQYAPSTSGTPLPNAYPSWPGITE